MNNTNFSFLKNDFCDNNIFYIIVVSVGFTGSVLSSSKPLSQAAKGIRKRQMIQIMFLFMYNCICKN